MLALLALPLVLQAIVIGVDEGYFHRQRGLPRWERIGHPFDTATVLMAYGYLVVVAPVSTGRVIGYVALAALSSLLVTKDEWVHARLCPPAEHWLHAVLFLLHPLVFFALGVVWPIVHGVASPLGALCTQDEARLLAFAQVGLTAAFFLVQVFYWNGPGSDARAKGRASS